MSRPSRSRGAIPSGSPGASHGIVVIAAADLRREPAHESELRSQLLLGESVRIEGSRDHGRWLRVRGLEDGYPGWIRAWALRRAGPAELRRWRSEATFRVSAPIATVRDAAEPRRTLTPVFLGSRVAVIRSRGGKATVRLPDGRTGMLPKASLARAGSRPPALAWRLASLLGSPYLWGGRTPAGFDCSGFTQSVFAERGVPLPRDAKDQLRACRRLGRAEAPREGDLVFFGLAGRPASHVGIMVDRCSYVHCRGTVHHASLDPDNALCEKDLLVQLRGCFRPTGAAPRAPKPAVRGGKSP